jgi:hypothetical protein
MLGQDYQTSAFVVGFKTTKNNPLTIPITKTKTGCSRRRDFVVLIQNETKQMTTH